MYNLYIKLSPTKQGVYEAVACVNNHVKDLAKVNVDRLFALHK